MIQFTIPSKIQPQARPRFNSKTKQTYTPQKSANFKRLVQGYAARHKPQELLTSALRLRVDIFILPPKNYRTKPKLKQIEEGVLLPIKKPDLDNLVKGIKDGITGIIWKDDAQIVDLHVTKRYSLEERAEITSEVME